MKIGFIGVGWMGFGIANNILKNNHELFVIANKNRKPIDRIVKEGAKEVKSYADFVRASRPSQNNDKVLIPGDKEISTNEDRLKNGLPVPPLVWENIKQTADRLNVENLERFEKAIK